MAESENKRRRFRVILVPTSYGAPVSGTDEGPRRIASALALDQQPTVAGIEVVDPAITEDVPSDGGQRVLRVKEVSDVCRELKEVVVAVIRRGEVPVVLHGDDSSVIGTGFGVREALGRQLGVVYFDAHGDMNTPETSPSGCLYGMGLGHLVGVGCGELLDLCGYRPAVEPRTACLVGTRRLDPGERALIGKIGVAVVDVETVRAGQESVVALVSRMSEAGVRAVYMHVDQDVVDPVESGATLVPEPDGLHMEELLDLVKTLMISSDLAALSIGNYLPSADASGRTLRVIGELLRTVGCLP